MKAPAFKYIRPQTLPDCLDALQQYGDEAQVLAGGQSLMPMLNLRLANPAVLIDIGDLTELRQVRREADRFIIGALQTHADIAASNDIAESLPLLAQAVPHIAHVAIRSRGTIGGSIALADPAAEWPACCVALNAEIELASSSEVRRISAEEFFLAPYATQRQPEELITAIHFPARDDTSIHIFDEVSRRRGDFAIAGLALNCHRDTTTVSNVRVVVMGVGDHPTIANKVMTHLEGSTLNADTIRAAGAILGEDVEAMDDPAYPSDYRLHVARSLLERTLQRLAAGEHG